MHVTLVRDHRTSRFGVQLQGVLDISPAMITSGPSWSACDPRVLYHTSAAIGPLGRDWIDVALRTLVPQYTSVSSEPTMDTSWCLLSARRPSSASLPGHTTPSERRFAPSGRVNRIPSERRFAPFGRVNRIPSERRFSPSGRVNRPPLSVDSPPPPPPHRSSSSRSPSPKKGAAPKPGGAAKAGSAKAGGAKRRSKSSSSSSSSGSDSSRSRSSSPSSR
eukprot:1175425-Prorocentrum_minimum.AAC.2